MEASLQMAPYFGRSVAIVTDHRKACEYMRDYALLTGLANNVRGFEVIDWYIRDMINDVDAVARDVIAATKRVTEKTGAEAVIRAARAWGNEGIQQAAAEALCTLLDAADPVSG